MNEDTMAKYFVSALSASYLVAESDGEISGQEVAAFIQALKQLHDFDIAFDVAWEYFRNALDFDEEEHLGLVAEAAGLSEELRREILQVALAVASADGEVSLNEIVCLPDIAAALDIELGSDDDDEEKEEEDDSEEGEAEEADDGEASERFAASLREAEASLKAEGNPAPSASEISLRAVSDMLSGLVGNLEATLVQRRGFAAWEAGDYEAAYRFYLEAAEAGDEDAMYNLGQMYMAGEWVDVDLDQALSWWKRAAAEGHLMAQRNAWKAFWQRDDLKSAIGYAGMAAAQGDEESDRFVRGQILPIIIEVIRISGGLIAEADGGVSDQELAVFSETWGKSPVISMSAADLRSWFAETSEDLDHEDDALNRVSDLAGNLPFKLRQTILQVCIRMALSDHDFRPEEQEMVEKLAAALDVDLSDLGGGLGLRRAEVAEQSEQVSQQVDSEVYDPEVNPVLVAALNGDAGKVRELLSEGFSATDIHASGTDAVILAVREGHFEIVELLLQAGADPNRMNAKSGMTPLRMAVQQTRTEIVELLLHKGADADIFDEASGAGPLTVLVFKASEVEEGEALHLLDLLVAAGAKQRPLKRNGAVGSLIGIAAMQQGLPQRFLQRLAEGADQNDLDVALWAACIEGISENARAFITAGANVNMTVLERPHNPSAVGNCPIITAANLGHVECVRLLIEAGADVNRNAPPEGGQSALLMAAEFGHPEIVSMLLDAGADLAMVNPRNGTHPLGGAVVRGHAEIVRLLLKAGADPNIETEGYGGCQLLTLAARDGHSDIVRLLIEYGAEVDATGSERVHTALILAAHQGHAETVSLLLDHGADVNKANPVSGHDAILEAVNQGKTQCVRLLLAAGADPNRSYDSNTGIIPLLVLAGDKGNAEIVRLLVEHGADVTAVDGEGMTALQRAGIHRHKEVEAVLIEFGADPSTRLVKFTDTPAGREMENELLIQTIRNLKETADKIGTLKAGDTSKEASPETRPRGVFARLFRWDRRP